MHVPQIGDKTILGLTRAEVVDLLESFFSRKQPAPLTVMYNTKALSQLPPEAKDDFHVRYIRVSLSRFTFCPVVNDHVIIKTRGGQQGTTPRYLHIVYVSTSGVHI